MVTASVNSGLTGSPTVLKERIRPDCPACRLPDGRQGRPQIQLAKFKNKCPKILTKSKIKEFITMDQCLFMPKVKLATFDVSFLKRIKDYRKIHLDPEDGIFYTIILGGKKAGVIGFKTKETNLHFLKIGIHQNFRGQGIFEKALNLLAEKHKIKRIYSTVALTNIASVKAHEKIGFKRIPKREEDELKEKKLLLKRNIRMVKFFRS